MAAEIKPNLLKLKPNPSREIVKGKGILPSAINKRKLEGSSTKPMPDLKQKSVATVSKIERKIETSSTKPVMSSKPKTVATITKTEVKENERAGSSSKTITKTATVTKVREKKVYGLPGQKYDAPEEREPLRIFYESLLKQIPSSEMAEFWMMEHGLLTPERAKKAHERKQRRQKQLKMGTPIKSPKVERLLKIERPESSAKALVSSKNGEFKPKKRSLNYSDDDDDFIVKHKKGKG